MDDTTGQPETPETPDPVNRWATEHYGFDDDDDATRPTRRDRPGSVRAGRRRRRPRRTVALAGLGALGGVAVAVGFGGVALADVTSGLDLVPGLLDETHHHGHRR